MGMDSAIRAIVRETVDHLRTTLRDEVSAALEELKELRAEALAPRSGLLTVADAAAFCSVQKATIREWIRSGELRALVLPGGREYRIQRAELEAVLKNHRGEPARQSIAGQVSRILGKTGTKGP